MSSPSTVVHTLLPRLPRYRITFILLPIMFAAACVVHLLLSLSPTQAFPVTPASAPPAAQPSALLAPEAITPTPSFDARRSPNTELNQAQNTTVVDMESDLAATNGVQSNPLAPNSGPPLTWDLTWYPEPRYTSSVAWGDVDGDGDLDLLVGNSYQQPNQLYRNDGGTLMLDTAWIPEPRTTWSVAWGDVDGDGDLDLLVGNHYQSNQLYRNDGGTLTLDTAWNPEWRATQSVAWGDVDGDGDLDLLVGNSYTPNQLYRNGGHGFSGLPNNLASPTLFHPIRSVNFFATAQMLDSHVISLVYALFDPEGDTVSSIRAFYSPDGGGKWYTATATSGTGTANLSTIGSALQFDGINDYVEVPDSSSLDITNSLTLEAWVNLSNPNNDQKIVGKTPIGPGYLLGVTNGSLYPEIWDANSVWYSFQAGSIPANQWTHLAVTWQTTDTMIGYINGTPVMTIPTDGIPIGTSANVLRIGSSSWGGPEFAAGMIDDVRVYNRALSASEIRMTMSRALVGDESGLVSAWGFDEGTGTVTRDLTVNHNDGVLSNGPTWISGHVPARTPHVYYWDTFASGFFGQSDNVVFRIEAYPSLTTGPNGVPVFQHPYASATTFPFRVRGTQVQVFSGTQPISNAIVYDLPANQTVGAAVFDDGSGKPFRTNDQGYLMGRGRIHIGDRLTALLPITATDAYMLYYTSATPNPTGLTAFTVITSGVQALTVTAANPLVLFNLDVSLEWDARNDAQFMSQLKYDLQRSSELLYDWTNGQAALGPVNIYHDREHWLDADIRIYATNRMRPNAAQGGIVSTVITDPVTSTVTYEPGQVRIGAVWNRYGDPGGTLGEDWPRALAHELGHYALFLDDDYLGQDPNGLLVPIDTCTDTAMSDPYRDDYSELHDATNWSSDCTNTLAAKETGRWDWATVTTFYPWLNGVVTNSGPSGLPLAVTRIQSVDPITPATTLPVPIFYLSQDGEHAVPGSDARAFLFQNDYLTDLGSPTLDQVTARSARLGDRLCVFDLTAQRLGCEAITAGDDQLTLISQLNWRPELIMTPVTSRTIAITVTNVPFELSLAARLYSADDTTSPTITLSMVGNQYAGIFNLAEPSFEGFIHLWVNEPAPRREIVTDYAIGGNPARMRAGWARMRAGWAPASSSDGRIVLFGRHLKFEADELVAFQSATTVPPVPVWTTVVGHGYRLTASATAPDIGGSSIAVYYAGSEVPPGEENWLRIYYWNGATWQQLPTQLDTYHNFASALAQGPGLYALMASIEIPLYGPGWDLFAYPVQVTQTVTQALASIDGSYSTVYWYNGSDSTDPWKVYDVSVSPWVNDLSSFKFGEAYWISLTQSITLSLNGGSTSSPNRSLNVQSPPTTFYGSVLARGDFTPTAGMVVTAWINGKMCGQGKTAQINNEIVYSINVFADGPGGFNGCGAPGRSVTFKVSTRAMSTSHAWDNSRLWQLPLLSDYRIYLPVVRRS